MAANSLVREQIDSGQRLVDALAQKWVEVTAAFWVNPSDAENWMLYIASPEVKKRGQRAAFRDLLEVLTSLEDVWIQPSDVTLIDERDPATSDVISLYRRHPAPLPMRLRRSQLGNIFTEEIYVYPKPTQYFKGFDEIKRQYPSASAFRVTVRNSRDLLGKVSPCMGKLNATEFESRSPKTVLFLGPDSDSTSPDAELVFVHRPEGWNNVFNPASEKWEEVVHVQTGKPLYESVDFAPLVALKWAGVPTPGATTTVLYP